MKRVKQRRIIPPRFARCTDVLARDPTAKELDLALTYLWQGFADRVRAGIAFTNEVIFWP